MKNYKLCSMLFLLSLAGCRQKTSNRPKVKPPMAEPPAEIANMIDIPEAEDSIKSFFDDDINEFTLKDDDVLEDVSEPIVLSQDLTEALDLEEDTEFSWVEDTTPEQQEFKTVYFDFDRYTISEEQEKALAHNIVLINEIIEESRFFGDDADLPTVVIEGHACHSAGSRAYNLALSEKRAKVLADRLAQAGIPQECVKIVGRGSEVPAIRDGQQVSGDRSQQWANRRDEIRIIYS